MIVDVVKRVDLSKAAEERAAQEAEELEKKRISAAEAEMEKGKALSGTDVLKKAAAVDSAGIRNTAEPKQFCVSISQQLSLYRLRSASSRLRR